MSNENYTPPEPVSPAEEVVPDPGKPYKAYAGALVTLLGLLWAALEGKDDLGNMTAMEWASVIVPVILTFAAIYGVPNPQVVKPLTRRDDGGYTPLATAIAVVVLIIVVVVLLRLLGVV